MHWLILRPLCTVALVCLGFILLKRVAGIHPA